MAARSPSSINVGSWRIATSQSQHSNRNPQMTAHFRSVGSICCAVAIAVVVATTVACDSIATLGDQMVGCYAEKRGGPGVMRVSKDGGAYTMRILQNGKWENVSLARPGRDVYAQVFGADSLKIADGLVAVGAPVGLFRLKEPQRTGRGDSTIEYVIFMLFGRVPVYKLACT